MFSGRDSCWVGSERWLRVCCVEGERDWAVGGKGRFGAGFEGRLELVSAEVEGQARYAVEDAGWCGLAATYPMGRQHRGEAREYRSPLCQIAWQEVQEQ
jgi:hypothetical protein